MPQPFDYSLNVPNPANAVLQGVQQGAGLYQGLQQAKQQAIETKVAQQSLDRKTAFSADLQKISAAPTAAGYASLAARYPEFGAALKESHELLGAEEQKQNLADASGVYSALAADQPEIAEEQLNAQAEALRSAGRDREAKAREDLAKLVKISPETAKTTAAMYLSTVMGPKDFVEGFSKLETGRRATQLEGATLSEAEAKAEKAAVDSKYAESQAVADLEKKGWDVKKIQSDIQVNRENSRIAAMNAALSKETNADKKALLQSKLVDAQQKREGVIRERVANAESARGSIDNLINTVDRALKTPAGVMNDVLGPIDSKLPTAGQAEADFEALLDTLGSQAFLAMVPNLKGTGSLSNAEGEKLQAGLQSLSKTQSPERLLNNLREIQRLMLKARTNITERYGVPETVPDTPEAAPGDADLEALLLEYGDN